MEDDVFVENFSVKKCGYQLASLLPFGLKLAEEAMFGNNMKYLPELVCEWNGLELTAAYFKDKSLTDFAEAILEFLLKNPEKVEKIHKNAYEYNDEYLIAAKKIKDIDLGKLSDKELGELYFDLSMKQEYAHGLATTTTWFIDSHGQTFSKFIMDKTSDFVKNSDKRFDSAKVFSVLTTLPKNGLLTIEEIESLALLKKIKDNEKDKKIIINLVNLNIIPEGLSEDLKKEIKNHYEKWRWTQFDYMGPAYNIDYYLTIWRGLLKENINVEERLKELKEKPAKLEKERIRLFDELGIDEYWRRIYNLTADMAFLKGYRKDCSYHGFYFNDMILREMARRKYLSINQMYLLKYTEIADMFIKGKEISANEINKRLGYTIWHQKDSDNIKIYTGEEAKKFISNYKLKREEIDMSLTEFKGVCACNGKANGTVKIVNSTEEMHKMQQGNIMVSHTTFPSLVPAMKKAGAIVTEDGGITCHAAIVSRELGTPCVTGIKVATKVLKDGDEIEVDADKGIVRIIKRA